MTNSNKVEFSQYNKNLKNNFVKCISRPSRYTQINLQWFVWRTVYVQTHRQKTHKYTYGRTGRKAETKGPNILSNVIFYSIFRLLSLVVPYMMAHNKSLLKCDRAILKGLSTATNQLPSHASWHNSIIVYSCTCTLSCKRANSALVTVTVYIYVEVDFYHSYQL